MKQSLLMFAALLACSPGLGNYPCTKDTECPTGSICGDDGHCQEAAACGPGLTLCHACVNLQSDAANCGACGKACPTDPHGVASCQSGACALSCNGGFALQGDACIGPPAAPAGLTASGGRGQIALAWTASAQATSYHVRRGSSAGGPYAQIDSTTDAAYTDTAVSAGVTYFYVVRAVDAAGEGADSSEASAITAPAAPTGLHAAGGANRVDLTWTAVTGATGYAIQRGTAPGGPYATSAGTSTSASFGDTGLTAGAAYYYVVTASNASGASLPSAEAGATTIPPAPAGLAATGGDHFIHLAWNRSGGAKSYDVLRGSASGGETFRVNVLDPGSGATAATDDVVGPGQTFFYVVQARNDAGASGSSNESSATSFTTGVVNLTATGALSSIQLNWDVTAGASGYNVYRSTTGAPGSFTRLGPNPTTTGHSFTDPGVGSGQYFYGVSVVSGVESGTTQIEVPATPSSLTAAGDTTQVTVGWAASAGAASYTINRGKASGGYDQAFTSDTAGYSDTSATENVAYYYQVLAIGPAAVRASLELAVPPAPTALAGGVPSANSIPLSWTGAPGVTAYNVLRSDAGGAYAAIASAVSGGTYTDSDASLSSTVTYAYAIASSAGAATRASAPLTVYAAPAWSASSGSGAAMSLAWAAVPGAGGYQLLRSTSSGGPFAQVGALAATAGASDSGLTAAQDYFYELRSVDATPAPASYGFTSAVLHVPAATSAPALQGAQSSIAVSATGGTTGASYAVLRDGAVVCAALASPSCTDSSAALVNTATYVYAVNAIIGLATRASDSKTLLPAPAWQPAVSPGSTIHLSWSAVGGAQYGVSVAASSPSGPFVFSGSKALTGTTATDTIDANTAAYYVVQSYNATGDGSLWSNVLSVPPVPQQAGASGDPTSIAVSWVASGVESSWLVERGTASGSYGAPIAVTTPQQLDSGLTGRSYYYRLSSVAGPATRQGAEIAVPSARVVTETASGPGSVSLGWVAGTESTPVALTGIAISRQAVGDNKFHLTSLAPDATSGTDNLIDGATAYDLSVIASTAIASRASATLRLPEAPAITQAYGWGTTIAVAWTAAAHATSGYQLLRGPTAVVSQAGTSYSDGPLTAQGYTYTARAVADLTRDSAAVAVPAPPVQSPPTPGATTMQVSWASSSGATGYRVFRSTTPGGEDPNSPLATLGNVTSYGDSGLAIGQSYAYVIQATSGVARSIQSSEQSAATFIAPPVGLTGSQSNKNVQLSWTPSAGATSYEISRSDTQAGPYTGVGSSTTATYAETLSATGTVYYNIVATDGAHLSATSAPLRVDPRQFCVYSGVSQNIEAYDETQTNGATPLYSAFPQGSGGGGSQQDQSRLASDVGSHNLFFFSSRNLDVEAYTIPLSCSGTCTPLFTKSANQTVSSAGGLVFVEQASTVTWYSTSGTQVGSLVISGSNTPQDAAYDPATNELFVLLGTSGVNVYDFSSLTLKRTGNLSSSIQTIAVGGGFLYAGDSIGTVYKYAESWTTGPLTSLATVALPNQVRQISLDLLGGVLRATVSSCNSSRVYTIPLATFASPVAFYGAWGSGACHGPSGIALCN